MPLFPSALSDRVDGVARVINRSPDAGEVTIDAFDDAGRRFGPLTLSIDAYEAVHFTSDDLEYGNPDLPLEGLTGSGQGDWHLALTSDLDIEALCYARDADGFFTTLNAVAPNEDGTHRVATLNPGYNTNQVGRLRLVNPTDGDAEATVHAVDGVGNEGGMPMIDLPADGARTFTSEDLEPGDGDGVRGGLGAADGKWRLTVESERNLVVMSLVSTPTGHLTNFLTAASNEREGIHLVRYLPPASNTLGRQGFVRVINRSAQGAEVSVAAEDDSSWEYEPVVLTVAANAAAHFNTHDLEQGNESKGLSAGVGAGQGDWRLELTGGEDIEVLSFMRTRTGFVTAMDGVAVQADDGSHRYYLPFFQPADHAGQESHLRLTNAGDGDAAVTIRAMDDRGEGAPDGSVGLSLQAGTTLTLTAAQLERGAEDLSGRLGDGFGSWQLWIQADVRMEVMGLGHADNGLLENLSRGRAGYRAWPLGTADLVVQSFSVDDTIPSVGDPLTLSATVSNRGDGDSPATTLRYYRSDNATISTFDTEVEIDSVVRLVPDGSAGSTASLNAPAAGTYYFYGACVDAIVGESDTSNNCSAAVAVNVREATPDLVVEGPSVNDVAPAPGDAFTFSATVRNAGNGGSPATTLRYYRSADATISTEDTETGTDQVAALAATAGSDESITLTVPSDAGTHYYGACVDAVEGETDTTNNCSSAVAVTVRDSNTRPDLVASASLDDQQPDPGEPVELSATVNNVGDATSPATILRYYRSDDATITTTDAELDTDNIHALPEGGSETQSTMLDAPANAGTYFYGACVDVVENESNTTNNCSSASAMTVSVPVHPDLVVGSLSASADTLRLGETFTFSAIVRNAGNGGSPATTLRYYRSADATISTEDTQTGTDQVAALAATAGSDESITLTAPSDAGTHYYGACVDAVEGEADTTNNCSQGLELIVTGGPDLVVVSPSVDDTSPAAGGMFTFSAAVANTGDTGSATTTLRYFRSTDSTISTADTEVGTDAVLALARSGTDARSIGLLAPRTAGTYHYGACVDAVADESDTANNCSSAISISVPTSNPYYGGHAVSTLEGCDYAVGIVLDKDSAEEAIQAARQACYDDGGRFACGTSAVTFRQCVATFWARGGDHECSIGPGRGATEADAEAAALAACRRNAVTPSACTVVTSGLQLQLLVGSHH